MKLKQISRIFLLAALGIVGISMASAQNFVGGVRGSVQDPGGAVIAGATVTLTNQATGVTRTTTTNATGQYAFSQVDPATYSITVEAQGFKKLTHPDVIVGTQETVGVDIKMELGQMTESVQVTTEVPLVENTNASNGQVLNSQQVTDLPNLGRNVFLLSKLSTNTEAVGDPRYNRFQDQSGSSQIAIAGGPIRGNNYLIDGIPVTDSTNRAVIIPTYEGVQEMKLQEGTYDATMGRTGGGVFNTVLKTGTNDFHGDVFGYYRTTVFTANTFFNNSAGVPRALTKYKNFGGGMGGPVVIPKLYDGKNRTFFYVAQEAYRQNVPLTNTFALPTALEKTGNFSQSTVTIYDPLSTRACTVADNCPSGVSNIRTPFAEISFPRRRSIQSARRLSMCCRILKRLRRPTPSITHPLTRRSFEPTNIYISWSILRQAGCASPDLFSMTRATIRTATLWEFRKAATPAPPPLSCSATSTRQP